MKKGMAAAVLALLLLWTGLLGAAAPIKLVFNGVELVTDTAPVLSGGRTLVPLRVIGEALGADVRWDAENNAVIVDSRANGAEAAQLALLEEALAPQEPREAAVRWAEGVQKRNGALQYAVCAPELRRRLYPELVGQNWVTGVSSPWVESFTVTEDTKPDDATYRYEIEFCLATSAGSAGRQTQLVTIRRTGENWLVAEIAAPEAAAEGIRLDFLRLPVSKLSPGAVPAADRLLFSQDIAGVKGEGPLRLHIYAGDNGDTVWLEDSGNYYDLTVSSEMSAGGMELEVDDLNCDGTDDLTIFADLGATCKAAKIFSFSAAVGWQCILTTENLAKIDFDNDGKDELITTSLGSLPPYILVYRWEGTCFAQADILAATGSDYATLYMRDGRNYIEAGEANEPHYYEYSDGSLLERCFG